MLRDSLNHQMINDGEIAYYPSLMIKYDFISRNIEDKDYYVTIYKNRLDYKAKKDKRAEPLKLVLNTTYGATKEKANSLYDPLQGNQICVVGQLFLLDLIERVEEAGYIATPVNINTDGVCFKILGKTDKDINKNFEILDDIAHEWEQRTKMCLEFDEYVELYQRDVNSYVIIDAKGKAKRKGAFKPNSPIDNDLTIVKDAVVKYMLDGTRIEDTINSCDKLIDFQKIYKIGSTYETVMHGDKVIPLKVNRVFASKDTSKGALYKAKMDIKNDIYQLKKDKFPSTPEHCLIINDSVIDMPIPQELDRNWYIDKAIKLINSCGVNYV